MQIINTQLTIDRLNQDYNWLEAHEMPQMCKDILDAINTIVYLEKELKTANTYVNNYKKALEALK